MAEINVLMVTETFPPNCGGGGWSTYHLAKALNKTDEVNIDVLAVNQEEVKEDELKVETISVKRFPNELAYYQIYKEVKKRKDDYDIIQGQHSLTIPPLGLINDKPTVGIIRDYWPVCYRTTLRDRWGNNHLKCGTKCLASTALDWKVLFPYKVFSHHFRKHLTRRADILAARSRFVEERLNEHGFDDTDVMYNFVPEGFASGVEATGEGEILYIGKLEKQKGPQLLIDAIPEILKERPDQKFVFLGEGEFRDKLENKVNSLGIHENVRFEGYVSMEEVKSRLNGAKAVISPSLWHEPLSRVIMEAQALKTPVVTTDRGGNTEAVREENVFCSEDSHSLAEKILTLENHVKSPKKDFEVIETWEKAYRGLLNEYRCSNTNQKSA